MLFFLGVVGAFNAIAFGFVVFLCRAFGGLEALFENVTSAALAVVLLKGLIDNVLSYYLWARAVLLTSPTIASVGLSMQIPMAAGAEVASGRARWTRSGASAGMMLGWCALVVSGFLGVVFK